MPVLPVCVTYQSRWHNPAWTIIQEPWHLLRLMCQFDNKIEVQLLPAYAPSEQEKANPALFAENVRQLMVRRVMHLVYLLHLRCEFFRASFCHAVLNALQWLRGACERVTVGLARFADHTCIPQ